MTLISDALQRSVKLRISANALRTVEHRGGLDAFLAKQDDADLSRDALAIKKEIAKKAEPKPAAKKAPGQRGERLIFPKSFNFEKPAIRSAGFFVRRAL